MKFYNNEESKIKLKHVAYKGNKTRLASIFYYFKCWKTVHRVPRETLRPEGSMVSQCLLQIRGKQRLALWGFAECGAEVGLRMESWGVGAWERSRMRPSYYCDSLPLRPFEVHVLFIKILYEEHVIPFKKGDKNHNLMKKIVKTCFPFCW